MSSPTETPAQSERTPEQTPQENDKQENPNERDDADRTEQQDERENHDTEHLFDDDIEMQDKVKEQDDNDKLLSANDLSDDDVDPSKSVEDKDLEEETLFLNIYTTPASVPGLVVPWMTHIQTNGPAAVASILSLVVSVSRAIESPIPDLISPEAVVANDPTATVSEIREIIAADAHGRVVITSKDTSSRRIRRAYEDFWRRITAEATDVVLYDTDCFDTLITWLDAMASSPSRSLRLAACLGAYRMVDGFIEKGNKIRKQLASMQRQLNTEKRRCGVDDKKKKPGKQLSQKGKELVKKVDELTANNSEVIELSDKIFRALFVVKYRDISPDIRNASVSALGGWILSFPDHFLDDSNNKYIGWLLSDKDPIVRKSSLDALLRMLKKKDFFASLELFLKRFSDRIVEMTRDKDDHVSVGAISLLTCLIEYGIVENEACEQVCATAIEEPHMEIRRAAGEFMARLIIRHYGNAAETSPPKRGRAGRTSDGIFNPGLGEIPSLEQSREYIKELLFAVLRKADEQSTPYFAVDSVWDSFPAVRCWEAFSALLLEERDAPTAKEKGKRSRKGKTGATQDEDDLNDFDKAILCEMLLASAKEASGNGDAARARLVEKGERLHPEPPAVLLSQHFLPLLPKLLSQFQTDLRALCALVRLPIHFSPKVFDQDGQDTHFTALLAKTIDVLTRNTGAPEVSSACAETLRSLLSDHNPLKQHTITALQTGCTEAAKDLTLQVRSDLSKAQPEGIASAILRVRILSELVDPGSSVEESILKLFEYQVENSETSELGDDVTTDAARTASALTIWSLARVRSRLEGFAPSDGGIDGLLELEEVKDLRRLGAHVVDLLHRAFASNSLPIATRVNFLQAFLIISTLARGIEKLVVSNSTGKQPSDDTQPSAIGDFDILNMQGSITALVHGLKTCVGHLMEHQLELKDHSLLSSQTRRSKIYRLPDEDVRNCFASLVQASFQSAFSSEISHLPLLGLLLRRNQHDMEPTSADFTAFHLCCKYCQQRQLRESSLIKDEVRVLRQVASFDVDGEQRQDLVRELAEALLSSRQHGELKITAAQDLLKTLMNDVAECEEDKLILNVEIVSNAGFCICSYLSQPHATSLLGVSKEIQKKIEEAIQGKQSSETADTFQLFHHALESVAKGESPDVPKHQTKMVTQRKRKRTKKRRRTSTSTMRTVQSPTVENRNIRRSSRTKKAVNYAQMQSLQDDSEGDSDEMQSSDDDEQSSEAKQRIAPQNAAEMARNLMRYGNSPRPPLRDSHEVPKNELNPRKRGRPSMQRKKFQAGSPVKSTNDSPRPDTEVAGLRRSSRSRKSSAKALASQENEGTSTEPRRMNQDNGNTGSSAEMNGSLRENVVADDGNPETDSKESNGTDVPAPERNPCEEDEHDQEDENPTMSHATAKKKESTNSSLEEGVEQGRSSSRNEVEASESTPGAAFASTPRPEIDSSEPPKTPQRDVQSGNSAHQSLRRSPRKLSSPSTGSRSPKSPTPTKGRIQKSPGWSKGSPANYSQSNKENVNGSPPKADGANSKLSKIRRRRRRQW